MTSTTTRDGAVAAGGANGRPRPRRRVDLDLVGVAALCVGFVALSAVWLALDGRVPDYDSGKHLLIAYAMHDALAAGQVTYPFETWTAYPPLPHLVSALATLAFGIAYDVAVLAQNVVFVPALALGCFLAGRAAYGSRAGLLAAAFALTTPMVVSLFHLHMIDVQQAAMVALAVGLVLASDRFRLLPLAALAGVAAALAMLTKQTSAFFLAGLVLVAVLRGGWRRPLGVAAFALPLVVLGAPWYLEHLDQVRGLTVGAAGGATTTGAGQELAGGLYPARWSTQNLGWYVWDALNLQLFVPFVALFAVGTVVLGARYLRRPRKDDLTPELVVGGLVSWAGLLYVYLKDPRYSIPALVYVAVLAVGWIGLLAPRARLAVTGLLVLAAVANVVSTVGSVGDRVALVLPGAPDVGGLYERHFTLWAPGGYIAGGPVRDGEVVEIMEGLRDEGVRTIEFDPGADALSFNRPGLMALAREADIDVPAAYDPAGLRADQAFMLVRLPAPGLPRACTQLEDTRLVYVVRGSPLRAPFERLPFVCPLAEPRGGA